MKRIASVLIVFLLLSSYQVDSIAKTEKEKVDYYINRYGDINAKNEQGVTILRQAISEMDFELAKYLILNGANIRDSINDISLVHMASISQDYLELLSLLLERSDKTYLKKIGSNLSPLHIACRYGNIQGVNLLLENGFEVNARTNSGETPLMMAMVGPNTLEISRKLIKAGAKLNLQNKDGITALHMAARIKYSVGPLLLLLKNGADPHILTNNKISVMAIAKSEGHLQSPGILYAYYSNIHQKEKRNLNKERLDYITKNQMDIRKAISDYPADMKRLKYYRENISSILKRQGFEQFNDNVSEALAEADKAMMIFENNHKLKKLVFDFYYSQVEELFNNQGLYNEAIKFNKLIAEFREEYLGSDHFASYSSQALLGASLYTAGYYSEALPYIKSSISNFEKFDTYEKEKLSGWLLSLYSDVLLEVGSIEKSSSFINRALAIFDTSNESGHYSLPALLTKAKILRLKGEKTEASKILKRISKSYSSDSSLAQYLGVQFYMDINSELIEILLARGEHTEALKESDRMLNYTDQLVIKHKEIGALAKSINLPSEKYSLWDESKSRSAGKLYVSIAKALFINQKFNETESVLNQIPINNPEKLYILSRLHEFLGEEGIALAGYNEAIELTSKYNGLTSLQRAKYLYAKANLLSDSQITEAKKTLIDLIKLLSSNLSNTYLVNDNPLYSDINPSPLKVLKLSIKLLHDINNKKGKPNQAITELEYFASELVRSHVNTNNTMALLDSFSGGRNEISTLLINKKEMEIQKSLLSKQLNEIISTKREYRRSGDLIETDKKLAELEGQLDKTNSLIGKKDEYLLNLISGKPVATERIRKNIHSNEAIITYLFINEDLHTCLLSREDTYCTVISSVRNKALNLINRIRYSTDVSNFGTNSKPPEFPIDASKSLYKILIESFNSILKKKKRVYVSTDEALQSLPFGLLASNNVSAKKLASQDWLINQYEIVRIPSSSTLFFMRDRTPQKNSNNKLLGIGDTVYKIENDKILSEDQKTEVDFIAALPQLKETKDEILSIASNFETDSVTTLFDREATENNLKKLNLDSFNSIVFATHATLAGEMNMQSEASLILSPEFTNNTLDGLLTSSEIARMKINSEWVVLSACNTARSSSLDSSPTFSGLSNSFLYAGADAVLASHWPVESKSTAEFTKNVFSNLKRGRFLSKSSAYQRTAIQFLKGELSKEYSHPFYWSAFELIGAVD
jgi:CHAT domain-containing protein/ankyrin repeat protein